MGLLDRYVTQVTGPPPDPVPLVGPLLDADDRMVAWAKTVPLGAAGGADGSIGRTLPQDPTGLYLVVSHTGLSAWHWSGLPSEMPAAFYRIAGENVIAAADTGAVAGDGAVTLRVAFVDASSFDFRVLPGQEAFLAACAQRWPGN